MSDGNATQIGAEQNVVLVGKRSSGLGSGEQRIASVIEIPAPANVIHSRKPERIAELAELLYPNDAKLELFARLPRKGWTVWGNQADGNDLKQLAAERSQRAGGHEKQSPATGRTAHIGGTQQRNGRARPKRTPKQ
jgi:N6-adenosine-specific RNA methylase IME4